jgi:hypothetical protein
MHLNMSMEENQCNFFSILFFIHSVAALYTCIYAINTENQYSAHY